MSCRARIRASSQPTWPIPKIATAGTVCSGSNSTVTSPPQHWTPCCAGARSVRPQVRVSGSRVPAASNSRAASSADCSRLPPPMLPQQSCADTTIFAPASRGACPRTAITVTSTPGTRCSRSRAIALIQCISRCRLRRSGRRAPPWGAWGHPWSERAGWPRTPARGWTGSPGRRSARSGRTRRPPRAAPPAR